MAIFSQHISLSKLVSFGPHLNLHLRETVSWKTENKEIWFRCCALPEISQQLSYCSFISSSILWLTCSRCVANHFCQPCLTWKCDTARSRTAKNRQFFCGSHSCRSSVCTPYRGWSHLEALSLFGQPENQIQFTRRLHFRRSLAINAYLIHQTQSGSW